MSASSTEISLSPEDILCAVLAEPYTKHTAAALRWWLLCKGEAERFPSVMLGFLLHPPSEKCRQRSSFHFFRNSVEGYTRCHK